MENLEHAGVARLMRMGLLGEMETVSEPRQQFESAVIWCDETDVEIRSKTGW